MSNTTDTVISMEDFQNSKQEAINLSDEEKLSAQISQELAEADVITDLLLGSCPDCGDEYNSEGTIRFLVMNLVAALGQSGLDREEIDSMVDVALAVNHGEPKGDS